MAAEANKALVRRLVDELWNRGNAAAIQTFFASDLIEVVAQHHRELVGAFSELEVVIDDVIAEGDKVAARLTISGVHDGKPFAGQPATGASVRYASFRFYRVADSKVVETWAMQDRLGLLRQLEAIPPPTGDVEWLGQHEGPSRPG